MKKVMSILTVAAFMIGAAGIVSFTVKQNNDEETGWFYVNPSNPNQALDPVEGINECDGPSEQICSREFHTPGGGEPTEPTTALPVYGERP